MTQDKALKMALEAMELVNIEFVCNGSHHAKKDRHKLDDDCPVTARYQQAITAIKEALAHCPDCGKSVGDAGHIHTCSPQRTWVGLNLNDVPDIYADDIAFLNGAKWAEAKLEKQNNA